MLRLVTRARDAHLPAGTPAFKTLTRAFHKDYNAAKEEQTLILPDGRTVGFAEYGNLNGGTPAFFFHGSPGSRYDAAAMIHSATRFNLRLICPDRPGNGLSTPQPGRKLSDYPVDIQQIAKQLNLQRYHVLGISGGGPYAIACARYIPDTELLSTSVIAGGGHPDTLSIQNNGVWGLAVSNLARRAPSLLAWAINQVTKMDPDFEKATKGVKGQSDEDKAELSDPAVHDMIKATFKAAYAQGPWGVIQDCQTFDNKWDFELKDISNRVKLFYGLQDVHTPIALARHYKQHLPNAELIEYDNTSHITIFRRDADIFENITGGVQTTTR